jgi:thiol:disulfide interchange protein DsbA
MWNPLVKLHGQLYFTEEVLVKNGKIEDPTGFRTAVFLEYHRRGNRLASEAAIQAVFERFGVAEEDFKSTWSSFEVAQMMRKAEDLARRWNVSSVPAVVVNGKYITGGGQAGSYPNLIDVIDELVARESVR